MLIIGLNGSPRVDGNTATMLQHALNVAAAGGAETRLIHVGEVLKSLRVPFCNQCSKPCRGRCSRNNQLGEALDWLRRADAVVAGSPVYFGTVSGQLKAFWDKTRILRQEKALLNVVGAALAVGSTRYGGQENVLNAIYHMMLVQGMTLVGDGHLEDGCGHHGVGAQQPVDDDTTWRSRLEVMMRRVVEVAGATRGLRQRK